MKRVNKWLMATAIIGTAWIWHHHAHAATFDLKPNPGYPGQFAIYINGEILLNDEKKFEALVNDPALKGKPVIVELNSPGGKEYAGLMIGAIIRDHGYNTEVTADTYCTSICAEIWLGGVKRYASHTSRIGFHSMGEVTNVRTGKRSSTQVVKRSDKGNDLVIGYHKLLGIDKAATAYLLAADPKEITWLRVDTADAFNIDFFWNDPAPPDQMKQADGK
jgi:hypothetical protein